jgi:hypothetical protein
MRDKFEHNGKLFYLVLIEPDDIREVWPYVKDGVDKAMLHSDSVMSGEDFLPDLESGSCRLWVFMSEAKIVGHLITQVIKYPRKSFMRLLTVQCEGGENGSVGMTLWSKFIPALEEYASREGCEHLEGYARKGMARSLERHGWKNQYSIITKSVEQMQLH